MGACCDGEDVIEHELRTTIRLLSADQREILNEFRWAGYQDVAAPRLARTGQLNWRGRISELRQWFLLDIRNRLDRVDGQIRSTYHLKPECIERAEHLLRVGSLAGFDERAIQRTLF